MPELHYYNWSCDHLFSENLSNDFGDEKILFEDVQKISDIIDLLHEIERFVSLKNYKNDLFQVNDRFYSQIILQNQSRWFTQYKNLNPIHIASPLLLPCEYRGSQDFEMLQRYANDINKSYSYIVLIGMGGTIFNPISILDYSIRGPFRNSDMDCYYCYSLNPLMLEDILGRVELDKTIFFVLSKSGNTSETLLILEYWRQKMREHRISNFDDHFIFIGGKDLFDRYIKNLALRSDHVVQNSSMQDLKEVCNDATFKSNLDANFFCYHHSINSRFSAFSIATMLIGLVAKIGIEDFFQGSFNALAHFYQNKGIFSKHSLTKAVLFHKNAMLCQRRIHVAFSYLYNIESFLSLYSYIASESYGKNKDGIILMPSCGPQGQHTHMQNFIDGADDKYYSIFTKTRDKELESKYEKFELLNYACEDLILQRLKVEDKVVREIRMDNSSLYQLGELMIFVILETVLLANILNVSPYTQPVVDQIKDLLYRKVYGK